MEAVFVHLKRDFTIDISLKSACDTAHCENGGTCQAGFTDKGYRCVCPPGFMFAHCKQSRKRKLLKRTFNFDIPSNDNDRGCFLNNSFMKKLT